MSPSVVNPNVVNANAVNPNKALWEKGDFTQIAAFMRQSGKLVAMITIRVPADTKKPVAMIQAPLGLFLPAGITVDVDGDMAQNYPLQTCNAMGCYAGFPITDQMLNRMLNGGKLNIIFQYLDKKPFTLPMSLVGFTEAYGRIKVIVNLLVTLRQRT